MKYKLLYKKANRHYDMRIVHIMIALGFFVMIQYFVRFFDVHCSDDIIDFGYATFYSRDRHDRTVIPSIVNPYVLLKEHHQLWTPIESLVRKDETATSSSVFHGNPFRYYKATTSSLSSTSSSNTIKNHDKGISSSEKLKPFHKIKGCEFWSVTTTIAKPTDALLQQMRLPDNWCMVIVGDQKGPDSIDAFLPIDIQRHHVVYLNVKDQNMFLEEYAPSFGNLLPWNHFGRKNVGYLFAIYQKAQLIWDFDDDNILDHSFLNESNSFSDKYGDASQSRLAPEKMLEQLCGIHKNVTIVATPQPMQYECDSLNPYTSAGAPFNTWPRGLPLRHIYKEDCVHQAQRTNYGFERLQTSEIGVCQSLANHDPDVDALYRLTQPNTHFDFIQGSKYPLKIPFNKMTPYNAQATLFTPRAFWSLMLPISVHGRVSDIWRSYIAQAIFRYMDLHVLFTSPVVSQNRNPHDYLQDFHSELPLYEKSEQLIFYLLHEMESDLHLEEKNRANKSKQDQLTLFVELYRALYSRGYVEAEDVSLAIAWAELLRSLDMAESISLFDTARDTKYQLFMPTHYKAMKSAEADILKTLYFFGSHETIDLIFVFDDPFNIEEREAFAETLFSSIPETVWHVQLGYNPLWGQRGRYGTGHDLQQLIMFWADNFTNAKLIGFVDDDVGFTHRLLPDVAVDKDGKPYQQVLFSPIAHPYESFWHGLTASFVYAMKQKEFLRGMNTFPFWIHREHLKPLRDYIVDMSSVERFIASKFPHQDEIPQDLQAVNVDPELVKNPPKTFDMWYEHFVKKYTERFSQFNMMSQYLWVFHQDAYHWYLESVDGMKTIHGYPSDWKVHAYNSVYTGDPRKVGATDEMLETILPRVAIHIPYQNIRYLPKSVLVGSSFKFAKSYEKKIVKDAMKTGFCYSLPVNPEHGLIDWSMFLNISDVIQTYCDSFDVWNNPNYYYQMTFEEHAMDYIDSGKYMEIHRAMLLENDQHDWDIDTLVDLFDLSVSSNRDGVVDYWAIVKWMD